MADPTELRARLDALDEGRAFGPIDSVRVLAVRGDDARRWLGDLVTADIANLEPGGARRSLLLTPTGRIRADFTVLANDEGFLLAQDRDQPEWIGDILAPYVLSSAVALEEVTSELEAGATADGEPRDPLELELARVRRGDPRIGTDYPAGALPAEADLESAIDFTKGCFLGQEAVAKVRNLGHPSNVLRHLRSPEELSVGASIHTPGGAVGAVTSVVPGAGGGSVLLARVDWGAAGAELTTAGGTALSPAAD